MRFLGWREFRKLFYSGVLGHFLTFLTFYKLIKKVEMELIFFLFEGLFKMKARIKKTEQKGQ